MFAIIVYPRIRFVVLNIPALPGLTRITVNPTDLERGSDGTLVLGDLDWKEPRDGGEFVVK